MSEPDLAPWTTFGVAAKARAALAVHGEGDLEKLDPELPRPLLPLGGGSNLLFTRDFPGTVLRLLGRGRRVLGPDGAGRVLVEAEAGEPWDAFVAWTLDQGLSGLENLSLIPGHCGAAPVQNVGAYGVELAERFVSLDAFDLWTGERCTLSPTDCAFGYRDSLFKHEGRDRLVVLRIRLALDPRFRPCLDYGSLRETVESAGGAVDAAAVRRAVIAIRRSKLPDPEQIGNAGSFFKNPVVPREKAEALRVRMPDLVAHSLGGGLVKLAAGQLVERAGLKGYRRGAVGVHERQALVLVNHGGGRGEELAALADHVAEEVARRFSVHLVPEVRIL